MKFQVLHGTHYCFTHKGKQPLKHTKGDVIESDADLALHHNRPGSKRFSRVDNDTPTRCSSLITPEEVVVPVKAPEPSPVEPLRSDEDFVDPVEEATDPQDQFTGLTVAELKAIAQDEEIDLGDATRKADILNVLRSGTK